ncbi:unnamed protein product, partial [Prorocentrum cordatum]
GGSRAKFQARPRHALRRPRPANLSPPPPRLTPPQSGQLLRGRVSRLDPGGGGWIACHCATSPVFFFDEHGAGRPTVGDHVTFIPDFSQGYLIAARVRCVEEVAAPSRHEVESAPAAAVSRREVDSARRCLQRHACKTYEEEYTHSSMRGCRDSFASIGKYRFGDEELAKEELAKAMATLYADHDRRWLYITEHPTPRYAFVEDIDIEGTSDSGCPDLMRPREGVLDLLKWRAQALRRLFPGAQFRCVLYTASGWYSGSELYKESYHLVWPDIIVDKDMAVWARQATVEFFEEQGRDADSVVRMLLDKAQRINPHNTWDSIFDATTTRKGVGLRMPLCDKRSVRHERGGKQIWQDELRPVMPIGVVEFTFKPSAADQAVEICASAGLAEREADRPMWQWVRMGMCRRPEGTPLTYMKRVPLHRPPPAPRAVLVKRQPGRRMPGSGTTAQRLKASVKNRRPSDAPSGAGASSDPLGGPEAAAAKGARPWNTWVRRDQQVPA